MPKKRHNTMAYNKLLILYLLRSGGLRLTEFQLVRIMDELRLMRYFDLKESLFELEQNGHVFAVPTPQATFYGISALGGDIIETMGNDLRLSARQDIDEYMAKNKELLIKESQFAGEYIKLRDDEYKVLLKVVEKGSILFEVDIVVHSRKQAQSMVDKWKDNAVTAYRTLLEILDSD